MKFSEEGCELGRAKAGVAVIGCGYWGKNLVRNFNELGVLVMVCDAAVKCRIMAAELAPEAEVVDKVGDVLTSEVSGVVIATPSETHFELTEQALEAGKDVLVEKPLALTYEQGVHLVRLAEERGRMLMVGHVLEYHPAVARLLALVRAGEIGKV